MKKMTSILFTLIFLAGCKDNQIVPFDSCSQARNVGAAPVHRGDPGYSKKIDADGDGVACE